MLDWNTSRVAQQLRYGSYLTPRQLYELGAMMLTEGEPQVKLPRLNNTSHNTNQIDIQSVARMNDQSVRQYLNMHLAEAQAAETSESSAQNVASSTTDARHCIPSRKQREFINDTYKDQHYWEKRRKNNDAARRSREKRRYHDMVLENRICDLTKENDDLRSELSTIKRKFNLPLDQPFTDDSPSSARQLQVPMPATSPGLKFRPDPTSLLSSKPQIQTSSRSAAYSSPPPLLAVGGPLPLQPSQTVYPSNGAQYPYYLNLPTSETSRGVITHESNGSNSSSHTSMRNNYQSAYKELTIKEEQEESKSPPPLSIALDAAEVKPPVSTQSYDYYHHHGNQGYSSDSWQGSPSNSNSYGSDEPSERPLQLTVRKDTDSMDPADKKESKSPQASSLPLKLRHKLPPQEYYSPIESSSTFPPRPYVNGLAQLSEIALAQANPLPLVKKSPHLPHQSMLDFSPGRRGSMDKQMNPKCIDPKYVERRRRNNEAARKCRENRKYVTNMREAKSDYLQQENGKLREELDSLHEEMKQLRELMEKKRLEQGLTKQEMDEKMKGGIPFEQNEECMAEQRRYHELEKKLAEHSDAMKENDEEGEELYMDESVDDEEATQERRGSTEDVNSSSS